MTQDDRIRYVISFCDDIKDEMIEMIYRKDFPDYWDQRQMSKYIIKYVNEKNIPLPEDLYRRFYRDLHKNNL